jgi:hypothetical protein
LRSTGYYAARDVSFFSALNVVDDNAVNLVQKYFESEEVNKSVWRALEKATGKQYLRSNLNIFLPPVNLGARKFNGGACDYHLASGGCVAADGREIEAERVKGWSRCGGIVPCFRIRIA